MVVVANSKFAYESLGVNCAELRHDAGSLHLLASRVVATRQRLQGNPMLQVEQAGGNRQTSVAESFFFVRK